ncbi:MAG: gamma-glutamylcyclotransferase [Thiotrichales bacterium]|nr:MAG: gamma-glutamylcyclotransferase [Thiotrichales bacterium]
MNSIIYFAYGSNMSTPRIQRRVESAIVLSTAHLPEHSLRFHKISADGSAKCDIAHTGNTDDRVYGVVFEILHNDKHILDSHEGLGNGYEEKRVSAYLRDGNVITATTYYATHIDASLQPYHWYKQHVLRGAREHSLPRDHIAAIEAISSIDDPNAANHAAELSVYRELD